MAGASSAVITGSAMTIFPWIESASGTPLRSRMSPRSAGRITVCTPSAAAIAAYDLGSMPWSCTSRAPKKDSTIAMRTRPTRRRSCGDPRRAVVRLAVRLLVRLAGTPSPSWVVCVGMVCVGLV